MKATVKSTAKRWLFFVVRLRVINAILRGLLRPVSSFLPDEIIYRIPVVGKRCLQLPNSQMLVLSSDGSDSLASRLFWGGFDAFEPETIDLYLRLLKRSEVVFDIGANTGLFALLVTIDCRDREVYFVAETRIPEILQGINIR